eukprot:3419361-Rhodomonas_salina.2
MQSTFASVPIHSVSIAAVGPSTRPGPLGFCQHSGEQRQRCIQGQRPIVPCCKPPPTPPAWPSVRTSPAS